MDTFVCKSKYVSLCKIYESEVIFCPEDGSRPDYAFPSTLLACCPKPEDGKLQHIYYPAYHCRLGHAVAQLGDALGYKSEGRGLDSRWCHWNFSLT